MFENQYEAPFIAFEGIDGSGKDLQMMMLKRKLKSENISVETTFEPTYSPFGSLLHQVLSGRVKSDPKVIGYLFVADRIDHLTNSHDGIINKLKSGTTILSSRYYFSSYAYQSVNLGMHHIIEMNKECRKLLRPTVNIFIDVDPDTAIQRINENRSSVELFENKKMLVQVYKNYKDAISRMNNQESFLVVDGDRSPEDIFGEIWGSIKSLYNL